MYARWGQDRGAAHRVGQLSAASTSTSSGGTASSWAIPHCVAEFKRYHREVGINHFVCVLNWPGMQHWQILRSIQLIGERVLPALA